MVFIICDDDAIIHSNLKKPYPIQIKNSEIDK